MLSAKWVLWNKVPAIRDVCNRQHLHEVLVFSYLKQVVILVAAAWQLNPCGQRDASNASAHCSSVPNCARMQVRTSCLELDTVHGHGNFSLMGLFGQYAPYNRKNRVWLNPIFLIRTSFTESRTQTRRKAAKRGTSKEQIPVLVMRDRHGETMIVYCVTQAQSKSEQCLSRC